MPNDIQLSLGLSVNRESLKAAGDAVVGAAGNIAGQITKKFEFKDLARTLSTYLGLSIEKIAERLARLATGFSEAQEKNLEKTVEATEKAADAQIAALEKLKAAKKQEAEESYRRSAKQAEDEYNLLRDFRIKSRQEDEATEKAYRARLAEYQQSLEDKKISFAEANFERLALEAKARRGLTAEEAARLKVLQDQTAALERQEQIVTLLSLDKRTPQEEALLQKLIAQRTTLKDQKKTEEEIIDLVKKRTDAEAKARAAWAGNISVTGQSDDQLSMAELKKKRDLLTQDIFKREVALRNNGWIGPGAPYDPLLDSLQRPSLARTENEIRRREQTLSNAKNLGEDRAFELFDGSKQSFDQILRGSVTQAEKTNSLLEKILAQQKQPQPVINLTRSGAIGN